MKRLIATVFILLLYSFSFAAMKAPDFELKDEDGKVVKLSDLKNDIVVLNFWATTCHSCRKELPDLEKLYQQYKGKVKFYGIVIDTDDPKKIKNVKKEIGFSFPVLIGNYQVNEKYRIIGTPITYVIGKDNTIVKIFIGPQPVEKIKEAIDKQVNQGA
ncbi:MAG: TlpA family protein disulfide reductase [Sulfurihydrogenibium sp.]|uniref:TlpA family protein disulfide reductase n=1 Tax=Sulfurihydrogenibium sp. TaxID=2053621 RepID=UPI000CC2D85C|nr:MAG: TlpA family protein disulfide reductase [Sulfurihydrogenibium sp.]